MSRREGNAEKKSSLHVCRAALFIGTLNIIAGEEWHRYARECVCVCVCVPLRAPVHEYECVWWFTWRVLLLKHWTSTERTTIAVSTVNSALPSVALTMNAMRAHNILKALHLIKTGSVRNAHRYVLRGSTSVSSEHDGRALSIRVMATQLTYFPLNDSSNEWRRKPNVWSTRWWCSPNFSPQTSLN